MRFTRRTLLKAGLATGTTAAVASVAPPLLEKTSSKALPAAQEEKWVPSVCANCPGTCGILVRVVDGRAVKIEGNPKHPVNRGRLLHPEF